MAGNNEFHMSMISLNDQVKETGNSRNKIGVILKETCDTIYMLTFHHDVSLHKPDVIFG